MTFIKGAFRIEGVVKFFVKDSEETGYVEVINEVVDLIEKYFFSYSCSGLI